MKWSKQVQYTSAVVALLLVLGIAASAEAQDRASRLRSVKGVVVDSEDSIVPRAIVYLKNLKTVSVKTYIADDKGAYRFSGLDPNVDYELHAEAQGMSSSKKSISSLDGRTEIEINLKLNKKK